MSEGGMLTIPISFILFLWVEEVLRYHIRMA